jgi:hypothetical protein
MLPIEDGDGHGHGHLETKFCKTAGMIKNQRAINRGLTLVNGGAYRLGNSEDPEPDHFDPGITYSQDLKFIVPDNDMLFEAGDGLVLVDDKAGEGL